MKREPYPSDLSNEEWEILKPLIPPEKPGGRPREVDMREILNGIFYVLRTGEKGVHYHMTFLLGERFITICANGERMEHANS